MPDQPFADLVAKLRGETHVQHPVRLVQNQETVGGKGQGPPVQMVDDPARRANNTSQGLCGKGGENSDPFHNPQIEFKPLYTNQQPPAATSLCDESVDFSPPRVHLLNA